MKIENISKLLILLFVFAFISKGIANAQGYEYTGNWERGNDVNNFLSSNTTVTQNITLPMLFGPSLSKITANFGDMRSSGRAHEGQDIMSPHGTPLVAPTTMIITSFGEGVGSGLYVNGVVPGGETFTYMHLDKISETVSKFKVINRGDVIGYVGSTGNAVPTGPHLHFEIRKNGPINPLPRITNEFTLEEEFAFLNQHLEKISQSERDYAVSKLITNSKADVATAISRNIPVSAYIMNAYNGITPIRTYLPTPNQLGASSVNVTTNNNVVTNLPPSNVSVVAVNNNTVGGTNINMNLSFNMRNSEVIKLQSYLIAKATGPQAAKLKTSGATGYFGAITKAALIEFQAANNISPAVGFCGPLTRNFISTH